MKRRRTAIYKAFYRRYPLAFLVLFCSLIILYPVLVFAVLFTAVVGRMPVKGWVYIVLALFLTLFVNYYTPFKIQIFGDELLSILDDFQAMSLTPARNIGLNFFPSFSVTSWLYACFTGMALAGVALIRISGRQWLEKQSCNHR